jgi:DNA-binding transcriptional LysR family regulator
MRLSYLKLFCDVARCRSFSEAALLNDVSQSAVSQTMLQLEKELGVQLIDRSTRPLQLTREGQRYYEGCRNLIHQHEVLVASVRRSKSQGPPTVQVVAIYSVGLRDMEQYLERFRALAPGNSAHIDYLHPANVYERVLEGTADFGLVSYPRKSRDLVAVPWREEEMCLACSPSHPMARRRSITVSDLQGVKYIGLDRDLVIRRNIDRFLRKHRVAVEVIVEFDNIETIKKAIEDSVGVALLPEVVLRKEVKAGILVAVPLADDRLVRPLGIIYRRHYPLTQAAQQFIRLLREPDSSDGDALGRSTPGLTRTHDVASSDDRAPLKSTT